MRKISFKLKYIWRVMAGVLIALIFLQAAFPVTTDFYLVISTANGKFVLTYEFNDSYKITCGEGGGSVYRDIVQDHYNVIDSKQMFHSDPLYEFHEKEVRLNLVQRMKLNKLLRKLATKKKGDNEYDPYSSHLATLYIDNKYFKLGSLDGNAFVASFGFYNIDTADNMHYKGDEDVIELMQLLLSYTKEIYGDNERWDYLFEYANSRPRR